MEVNLLDYYLSMDQQRIILYYKGPFDDTILAKISTYIKNHFADQPKSGHKLFAVFIELAQNIAFYSSEKDYFEGAHEQKGIGTILIRDTPDKVTFTAGNLVKTKIVEEIAAKCDEINSLTYEELRALKKEVRKRPRKEGHKGGSIGLIQVALKSESSLKIEHKPIDEKHSFFMISTDVEKEIKEG